MTDSCSARALHDLRFRSIRAEDWRRLQRFHARLSDTSIGQRFHGAKRELSIPMSQYFTRVDGRNDVALVATTGTRGRIVAVARYNRLDADSAEVAFVVEDAYQHHGIGSKLMKRLCAAARENGVSHLKALILPGNTAMLRLLQEAGPTHVRFRSGVVEGETDLCSS